MVILTGGLNDEEMGLLAEQAS
ncbi:hypothetical protein OIU78_024226 [Salix suchowensis]|nr:hypothetical protein OIU78_024226 [Salix suchowensis]